MFSEAVQKRVELINCLLIHGFCNSIILFRSIQELVFAQTVTKRYFRILATTTKILLSQKSAIQKNPETVKIIVMVHLPDLSRR